MHATLSKPEICSAVTSTFNDKICENNRYSKKSIDMTTALENSYILGERLGNGGFGDVYLATHMLTGGKVAIKIIDKKKHAKELRFVRKEEEALKNLVHQNISRLYEHIENEHYLYFVMEFCNGGEMFDYIIKKQRLEENEARHFFRQLIQAMSYVHEQGYCHRDLKPENILLTNDLKLKVIDFGLCAKPNDLRKDMLTDYCGSPAYAAPELFEEKPYLGHQIDIWSMGIILYALLCGCLPFEDEKMENLRAKVTKGVLKFPPFLSLESRNVLTGLLTVNPRRRISMEELIVHPWVTKNYTMNLKCSSIYKPDFVDTEVIIEMSFFHCVSPNRMINLIKDNQFDYLKSTYLILLNKKENKENIVLPMSQRKCRTFGRCANNYNNQRNIIASPTIHASIENCLNYSGLSEDEEDNRKMEIISKGLAKMDICSVERNPKKQDKNSAYVRAKKLLGENAIYVASPSLSIGHHPPARFYHNHPNVDDTPRRRQRERVDKENARPSTVRQRHNYHYPDYKSVFMPPQVASTPKRSTIMVPVIPTHSPVENRKEYGQISSPSTPDSRSRITSKTPRLKQRVFASLERKADKMINLLTPKRHKITKPTTLTQTKRMVNVSITSSDDPVRVKNELKTVFGKLEMIHSENGWKLSGQKYNVLGKLVMSVELEVVLIENMPYVGVKRKRLTGDCFLYKKLCEQILSLAGL
uniref:non-specific serine/threonine protein kinase n=1 Tax=Parastrongyloides trichosuri TaxID=131310 RepID=A0A0N4ZCJ0_PARTI